MFTSPILLVLLAVAIVLFVVWRRTEERRYAMALGIVAFLIGLFFIYQTVRPKSPGEQIERKIRDMAAAVKTRNIDDIFKHFSEEFRFLRALDKAHLRKFAESYISRGDLDSLEVWKFEPAIVQLPRGDEKGKATIKFLVKPKGADTGDRFFRCEAQFVLDPDGEWRLSGFTIMDPLSNRPIDIPYLPAR